MSENECHPLTCLLHGSESSLLKALDMRRQGGIVLCPVCRSQVTFLMRQDNGVLTDSPSRIFCSLDKRHLYMSFSYRHEDDPVNGIE